MVVWGGVSVESLWFGLVGVGEEQRSVVVGAHWTENRLI